LPFSDSSEELIVEGEGYTVVIRRLNRSTAGKGVDWFKTVLHI